MGWTGEYMSQPPQDMKVWAIKEFSFDHMGGEYGTPSYKPNGGRSQVLDVGRVGNVLYLAVDYRPAPTPDALVYGGQSEGGTAKADGGKGGVDYPHVFGMVVLTRWRKREREFMFKAISETMGPVENRCPARILKLLTPAAELANQTQSPYLAARFGNDPKENWGLAWREACAANLAAPKPMRVKVGDKVQFAAPVKFRDGVELTGGEIVQHPWKPRIKCIRHNHTMYIINNRVLKGATLCRA